MRTRVLLLLPLTLLALAACDQPAPVAPAPATPTPASTSPAALAVPPLRLPSVAPGADCPTAPRQQWSGAAVADAVLGDAPVHPVADYFREGTILELRDLDRQPDGTYEKKVRWIAGDYTGPVLVRAGRIDGKGTARVHFSYRGEERDGGYYADLTGPRSDIPATTIVGGPGCYAYQVDGIGFSTTIVFGAA